MALFRRLRSIGFLNSSNISTALRGTAVTALNRNEHAQKRSLTSLTSVPVDDLVGGLTEDQIQVFINEKGRGVVQHRRRSC